MQPTIGGPPDKKPANSFVLPASRALLLSALFLKQLRRRCKPAVVARHDPLMGPLSIATKFFLLALDRRIDLWALVGHFLKFFYKTSLRYLQIVIGPTSDCVFYPCLQIDVNKFSLY